MENERIQTLKWLDTIPRKKLNTKKMVMVVSSSTGFVPKFVPRHLLGEKTSNVSTAFESDTRQLKKAGIPLPRKL